MIARIVVLALGAFAAWRFLARRSRPDEQVTIGWDDGSSIALDPGAPDLLARNHRRLQAPDGRKPLRTGECGAHNRHDDHQGHRL